MALSGAISSEVQGWGVCNELAGTPDCLVSLVALPIDSSVVTYAGDGVPAGVYLGSYNPSRRSNSAQANAAQ